MTIDDFMTECETLKKVYKWQFRYNMIRTSHTATSLCPITAMCFSKGLGLYSTNQFWGAANKLGLPLDQARIIAQSADNTGMIGPDVRNRLIEILAVG